MLLRRAHPRAILVLITFSIPAPAPARLAAMFSAMDSAGSTSEDLEEPLQALAAAVGAKQLRAQAPAPSASELKRARRSAIEKKSRQRRQGILRYMRDDVKRLEQQYAALARQRKRQVRAVSAKVPMVPLEELLARGTPRAVGEFEMVAAQLAIVAQALEDERDALRQLIHEHHLFHKAVRASGYSDLGGGEIEIDPHGVPVSSSFTAKFTRLPAVDCYAIVRESYETICRFDRSGEFQSFGTSFMGWTDKRKFDDRTSALNYGFTKCFPNENAEVLFLRTWDMFRDEVRMAQLSFDTSVRMRFEVIQRINDDVYIIRRDHKHPGIAMTFLTVHILFRLQTPTGYTLCMRTVPSPEIKESLEDHEIYFDVFHWSHFNIMRDADGNPAGCEVVTGGSIADPSMIISQHWLFELIISVLRWENACVSPLFLAF